MTFDNVYKKICEDLPSLNTTTAPTSGVPTNTAGNTQPTNTTPQTNPTNPNPGNANAAQVSQAQQKIMAAFNDPNVNFDSFSKTPEGQQLLKTLSLVK